MTVCSFSKVDDNGKILSMWDPEVGGNYAADCEKGRGYADEIVQHMRNTGGPVLLCWVIQNFNRDARLRGVEVGFCQRLAELAMGGQN